MRNPSPATGTKEARWRHHMRCWQHSGVSQREYCERAGLALSTFQLWRRRLGTESPAASTCVELVPVALGRLETSSEPVVLLLGRGRYRIEVVEGVSADALRTVISVLEERD